MPENGHPPDRLRCVVERVTYASDSYTVLKCAARGFSDLVTVVGALPETHVGAVLTLSGAWVTDSRYGRQFRVSAFEETLPATAYGIEKYLGSGLIKGIGPKYARRIVNLFGADTLEVIETAPERLSEVPGIGPRRVETILRSWTEQKEIKNIMLFLQGHNVSTAHATRIWRQYGAESLNVVQENPYRLADDIWGIGFRTADAIAQKLGFGKEDFARLRGGIIYTLNKLAEEGHCFAARDQLLEAGCRLLEAEEAPLSSALERMTADRDVITVRIPDTGETAVYLPPFYYAEIGVQGRLQKIAAAPGLPCAGSAESTGGMEYDEVQLQAIRTAAESKVMVLTGGPGTGKSTTTMGILRAFAGQRILLCAPTGRAAKRLSEVTGLEAKTIHRLLEFKPPEGYKRDEDHPLEGDVLIVDECSMVDVILMNALLRAVPDSMRLILVGDVDQLPSVGAGNVLRDIIGSGAFPVITLTRIFRQAASSRIITNAHRINRGEFPDLSNGRDTDFFFQEQEDPEQAARIIVDLVQSRLPKFYGIPPRSIQVLTPMQRGAVGAVVLNQLLQAALNPPQNAPDVSGEPAEIRRAGCAFRPGDKVMQIRNNYDKEVFNGDIGFIESLDPAERTLSICFDGRSVEYDASELDEIVLAYATTVHKAQGAEYPIVVMPVMMTHYTMLRRNLLYTGVTRAKKALVLVGQKKAVGCCVRSGEEDRRNTLLSERLSGRIDRLPENERYICLDVETPNAANNRISAIGISVVEGGAVTREFFSYVNPEQPFDYFNIRLTGIDSAKVAEAPTFAELWPRIEPILDSGIPVAHNAPFDLGVLRSCLKAYGIRWKSTVRFLCTVRIGRAELPQISHRLNDMCAFYEISLNHHQADSDSRACAEILLRYMQSGIKLGRYIRSFGMG